MKYVEYINELIRNKILEKEKIVVFGQNIAAGSCLGGLTRNLKVREGGLIINTQNSENTLCGVGFGLMLGKVASIYFMKQQDFLLLGIDQLVNTYNFIRRKNPETSFTIFPIIVDNGYQGLQSSLNNFGDFCSIARVPGFAVTNKADAEKIINSQLLSPGFRIIGVSQRLFGQKVLDAKPVYINQEGTVFQYKEGKRATIACFNFSFSYGLGLQERLKEKGLESSLFSVNSMTRTNWSRIIEDAGETQNLILIDDSKSENLSCYALASDIMSQCQLKNKIIVKRELSKNWLWPNPDLLEIDYKKIIEQLS
ncbi:MAG: hypothetical protein Q7S82_00960 [bacterium]|nr:hypothetical protein [bacterium]